MAVTFLICTLSVADAMGWGALYLDDDGTFAFAFARVESVPTPRVYLIHAKPEPQTLVLEQPMDYDS